MLNTEIDRLTTMIKADCVRLVELGVSQKEILASLGAAQAFWIDEVAYMIPDQNFPTK